MTPGMYEKFTSWVSSRQEVALMVKGVSRQVIVVHAPDPQLFEQAIFILKDEAVGKGITEERLLQEAQAVLHRSPKNAGSAVGVWKLGPVWACFGAAITGIAWVVTELL